MKTLKKSLDLYKIVAEELGIEEGIVKQVISHNFVYIGKHIKQRKTDPILLHNFGTFRANPHVVNNLIRGLIKSYQKGNMEREALKTELFELFRMRRELKNG